MAARESVWQFHLKDMRALRVGTGAVWRYFAEISGFASLRPTQRAAPQQRLYFLPLPQGQGSFRPRFGVDTCTFWRLNARRNRHRSKVWRSISKELKSGR